LNDLVINGLAQVHLEAHSGKALIAVNAAELTKFRIEYKLQLGLVKGTIAFLIT